MKRLGRVLYRLLVEVVDTVLPALVIAVLINLFVAQGTYVYGQSMEPNLHTDQRLIVEKVSYRLRGPRRGDIVVVRVPGHEIPLIKRVIGLPGEIVEVREGCVWVNGQPLDEAYLADIQQRDSGPHTVPASHLFVMGDNRNASNDSRFFGPVAFDRSWAGPGFLIGRFKSWGFCIPTAQWGCSRERRAPRHRGRAICSRQPRCFGLGAPRRVL